MAKTVQEEPESCDPKTKRSPAGGRSGGPRTALGKNRSKYNARTHGIFSKVVVLDGESQAEFDAQLGGLREHFRPVSAFEEGLVEILAVTRWRQRRLLVAEAAEIEAGRTFIEWDAMERQMFEPVDVPESRQSSGLVGQICNVNVLDIFLMRLGSMGLMVESDGLNFGRDRAVLAQLYDGLAVRTGRRTCMRCIKGMLRRQICLKKSVNVNSCFLLTNARSTYWSR